LGAKGIWEVPELMHRLAVRSWPPGDVGDNAEGVFFVIERVLRVGGSLVKKNECIRLKFEVIGMGVDGMKLHRWWTLRFGMSHGG